MSYLSCDLPEDKIMWFSFTAQSVSSNQVNYGIHK